VPEPRSFLHDVDARIKQLYLFTLLFAIARTPIPVRVAAAAGIIVLTIIALPPRLWKSQLGQLLLLSSLCFVT
jgi:energy-coupling factor transporter transmembrane protein EcfT